jgi:hypothetical protein
MASPRETVSGRLPRGRPASRWRVIVHATFGVLWCLGVAIFVLERFFSEADEFGTSASPWQPTLIEVHGIVAVFALYLFGWLSADHVAKTWRSAADRASGLWMLALVAALAVTGFAGFFLVDDSVRGVNGSVHAYLGLALVLPWVAHLSWFRGRAKSGLKRDGEPDGQKKIR